MKWIYKPVLGIIFAATAVASEDIVIADFEKSYDGWLVEGEAFGSAPCLSARPPWPGPYSGHIGSGWANGFHAPAVAPSGPDAALMKSTFHAGKASVGSLTSPVFKIQRTFINFLIGGSRNEKESIQLLIDNQVVASETGPNGSTDIIPRLDWKTWDVRAYIGKSASIHIVDDSTSAYLMIDQIVQSDVDFSNEKPRRELFVDRPYLYLPVKQGARCTLMRLSAEGSSQREFEIQLAQNDQKPDFWVYEDLKAYEGKTLTVEADWLPNGTNDLSALMLSSSLPGGDMLYKEEFRPQLHFSAICGRLADPVGLVWCDGEYHMFFEHWAYGIGTPMIRSWGHAVSDDLVHWKELPTAVYSDELGTVFSGCGVIDKQNTSGLQTGKEPPMLLFYTSAAGSSPASRGKLVSQSMAYSNDRGRSWTKFPGNPVIPNVKGGNRDPKIFWHKPSDRWVMFLYLQSATYTVLTSRDLIAWTRASDVKLPGVMENPDFYELPVAGTPTERKTVFSANGHYYVGYFDGERFLPEGSLVAMPWNNLYAEQTFFNLSPGDTRVIQMAYILGVKFPGMPFSQQMTAPRELSLRETTNGLRVCAFPVREIEQQRGKSQTWESITVSSEDNILESVTGDLFDIECDLTPSSGNIVFTICGEKVVYNAVENTINTYGKSVELAPENGRVSFRFLVDRTSIEMFANRGLVHIAFGIAPERKNKQLSLTAEKSEFFVNRLQVWNMKSIWN